MDVLFRRLSERQFLATDHVSGAWDPAEQHIAPALGLLAHLVEQDHTARRDDKLQLARVSFDIYGTFPVGEVEASEVRVVRAGRTIELVEVALAAAGRTVVTLRAWLLQASDTGQYAGSALSVIPHRDSMAPADMHGDWQGGYVRSFEMRREELGRGRAQAWMRPMYPLLDSEPVSAVSRMVAQFDLANGIAPRAEASALAFPNVDLNGSIFRVPQGDWLGFDTAVSFGPAGVGLTQSTLHDEHGPVAVVSQTLTLRER